MRIVCFGDSNTYGYDPRSYFGDRYAAEDRWVDLIAEYTGWECVNAGVNGSEIPKSSVALQLFKDADIFLIMLGTNDLLQGTSAKDTAARMENFLKLLLPQRKNILLAAPPPMKRGAWVPSDNLVRESICLAEAYRLVAERLNIAFIDTRQWNIELAFDGVHFTEEGHHTFANRLTEQLR